MAVAMKTYERMTVVAGTKEDPVRLPCACSKKGMSAGRTVRMLPDGAIVRGFVVSCPECGEWVYLDHDWKKCGDPDFESLPT
jgi:hypothetical protein